MAADSIRVKQLPTFPETSGWYALLGQQPPSSPLDQQIDADVVIIGAGFTGLSAARRLHQLDAGLHTVVLEAGSLAEGPAGRNSGFMIDLPHDLASDDYTGQNGVDDALQTRMNRIAIEFAREIAECCELAPDVFDPCGKINGAATRKGDKHNREYALHLKRMGEPFELLDAEAMRRITGTDYYLSGLFTPGTVMIQPAAYIQALASSLSPANRIFQQSPAVSYAKSGNRWHITTPGGSVSADKVILAVNGQVESFGFFKRRLMHVHTYASMTHPMTAEQAARLGGNPVWSITPADPMGVTVRRINSAEGSRLLVRSRFTYDPSMQVSKARISNISRLHDSQFRARFPMLKDLSSQYRWAGHLCLSSNGVSAFGEVDVNIFAACCQNGLGVTRGTLSGIAAAELALGQPSFLTDNITKQPQPRKLPPEPLAWLGANAVMRYKELRAGRE